MDLCRGRRGGRRGGRGGVSVGGASWPPTSNSERNPNSAEWVAGMVTAIEQRNGELFADLIREQERMIPDVEVRNMPEAVIGAIPHNKLRDAGLLKGGDSMFKKLLQEFLKLRQLQARQPVRWSEIVKQCICLLDIYVDLYVDPSLASCGWLVPGLAALCSIMNKAAYAADSTQDDTADVMDDDDAGDEEETQNKYTKEVLNAIRPKLGKVRGDEERHGAYIVLLGQSIKRCLQLGNMQMAAGFLKLCDSKQINFSRVPRGPIVNFRYYLGKLYMQQEQFEQEYSRVFSPRSPSHGKGAAFGSPEEIQSATVYSVLRKEWWAKSGLASKPNIVPISAFSAALRWQSDSLFDDDEVGGWLKSWECWVNLPPWFWASACA
ncbi:pci domain-containing protein [Cystoisospora suis]|uniref:Pci domain-containing protein n=1 Tax=Cystoisospora suis TaxID=483139 RepID=A0A2C6KHI3_9APIC|nr:pci domain-containing protein [Cystoisospora suis]